ncbi:MAG: c-type heme family protein [Methylocella sp.]
MKPVTAVCAAMLIAATPAVGFAQDRSYPDFGSVAKSGGPAPENRSVPAGRPIAPRAEPDAGVERTRQEVKMLDDLFKNAIVLIDGHYVKQPSDFPAATAAKALWAALKKDGWYDVRILGLLDVIGDPDDAPRDAFEQAAAKKLLAGQTPDEEIVEHGGKRYLRVATPIPVVSENCLMCHANFKGNKGNVGALSYTVPVIE